MSLNQESNISLIILILTFLIPGKLSKEPSTGTRRMKPTATGKKPLFERENENSNFQFHPE